MSQPAILYFQYNMGTIMKNKNETEKWTCWEIQIFAFMQKSF